MNLINNFLLLAVILSVVGILKYILNNNFNLSKKDLNIPLPYRANQYLFSRSEHEFLRILHKYINKDRYFVFPKVRLADFISVTARGREYQGWFNKIKSKHIDFLVWDVEQNKIVLAIELDGRSHNSERMHTRDNFVNRLYEHIGVKLERIMVGSNFENEIKNILNQLV